MTTTTREVGTKDGVMQVLVVDDHPIVRRGVSQLIQDQQDLAVCGEAESAVEAIEILRQCRVDAAVVDLSLSDASGVGFVRDLQKWQPGLAVLVLSMHDEVLHAERCLRAGASGYIMKHQATENIIDAIRQIIRGEIYLSEPMKERLLHRVAGRAAGEQSESPLAALTDRELEVFQLLGRGLSTREIASRLYLSIKTIETHRDHIKVKLGLESGRELVRFATSWYMEQA
jgi:DNA-binding NarL/FixJ family response regulator